MLSTLSSALEAGSGAMDWTAFGIGAVKVIGAIVAFLL